MQLDAHRQVLDEVEQDIAAYTERLRELNAVADYHARKLGISRRLPASGPSLNGTNGRQQALPATRQGNRFRDINQRSAAHTIILEAQQPMRATDIARVMIANGYPEPESLSKLSNSLFTTMTRDPGRFKKVGVGLWDVVKTDHKEKDQEEQGH